MMCIRMCAMHYSANIAAAAMHARPAIAVCVDKSAPPAAEVPTNSRSSDSVVFAAPAHTLKQLSKLLYNYVISKPQAPQSYVPFQKYI